MKFLIVLVCLPLLAWGQAMMAPTPVPDATLTGLSNAAIGHIQTTIKEQMSEFNTTGLAFKEANSTCMDIINPMLEACQVCVMETCKSRIEIICAENPNLLQILEFGVGFVGVMAGYFFEEFIPSLIVDNLGGVAVDIGNFFVDSGLDIGNFFVDAGVDIADFGTDIADGFLSGVNEIGNFFENIGLGALDAIADFGNLIAGGFMDGISGIGDIFGDLGGILGGLLGRRAAMELRRRQVDQSLIPENEPESCDEVTRNVSIACSYYFKVCDDCQADPAIVCPGYEAALEAYMSSATKVQWLGRLEDREMSIVINSVTVDTATWNNAGMGFDRTDVVARMFDEDLSFTVDGIINAMGGMGGDVIGAQMIKEFTRQTAPARRR